MIECSSGCDEPYRRLITKLSIFWRFTENLAGLSTCQRLRTSCMILLPDLSEIAAIGYNGPPAGEDNGGCRKEEAGNCGCIHAEANALVKLSTRERGLLMMTLYSPCEHCAGLLLNGGRVAAVIYEREYRLSRGLEVLRRQGVAVARWGWEKEARPAGEGGPPVRPDGGGRGA